MPSNHGRDFDWFRIILSQFTILQGSSMMLALSSTCPCTNDLSQKFDAGFNLRGSWLDSWNYSLQGKLPEAFYRIEDDEAREFVGRCLATASKRLPARELLLDPFLASDDGEILAPNQTNSSPSSTPKRTTIDANVLPVENKLRRNTDMTITGTMNSEDDSIYLKVQISDRDGKLPYDWM